MEFKYLKIIHELMDIIEKEENESMSQCVEMISDAIMEKRSIYTFGASHAGILSEELFYRAG